MGVEHYLITLALLPFTFCRDKLSCLITVVLAGIAFLISGYIRESYVAHDHFSPQSIAITYYMVMVGVFFTCGVIIFQFKLVGEKYETIIEQQIHVVEEKNKEITDSILYAKRIQNSILPTEKYIDKNLKRMKK